MTRQLINSDRLHHDVPYHNAAAATGEALIFTAGACPLDGDGHVVAPGDIPSQTRQALENLHIALEESGCHQGDVVTTTVFVASSSRDDLLQACTPRCRNGDEAQHRGGALQAADEQADAFGGGAADGLPPSRSPPTSRHDRPTSELGFVTTPRGVRSSRRSCGRGSPGWLAGQPEHRGALERWQPGRGGAQMAVASLLVVQLPGGSVGGLSAAVAAGVAIYLPVVYPMRVLVQHAPTDGHGKAAAAPPTAGWPLASGSRSGLPDDDRCVRGTKRSLVQLICRRAYRL